jgi:DNA (cytosine-5)-methyltransferase 1
MALESVAMNQPTPDQVKAAREAAGHSQAQAGALVHTDARTWRRWELGPRFESGRAIPLAAWELYLLKTGQAKLAR